MSCKRSSDIEEVKALFRQLDGNRDGMLNYKEFSAIFDNIGGRFGYKEKLLLFRAIDKDGVGSISFEEFVDYFFCPPEGGGDGTGGAGGGNGGNDGAGGGDGGSGGAGGGGGWNRGSGTAAAVGPGEQAPAADAGAVAPPARFAALLPHSGCGCRIPGVESRAITIEQIELVVDFCKARCTANGWVISGGPNQGKTLSVQDVTLYDICTYVIRPATESLRVSFVEMIADEPQPPVWFVSHWWGEPHIEFLACLQQHAKDRGLSCSESPYWVCAYANNQHELSEYVTDDPNLSAFRLAMDRAEGVVSVVDKGAMCFSRIWCCFEVFTCLEGHGRVERAKYDVYTAHEHLHCFTDKRGRPVGSPTRRRAVGIADGYAMSDNRWSDYKTNRESHFPHALIDRAMSLRLEEAQATMESDRRNILNTIVGTSRLHAEPPAQHPSYDRLNATLRGRMAASTLRRSVEAGGEVLERCIAALTGSRLRELQVDFGGCLAFTEDVLGAVVRALDPETLEMLVLSRCGQITVLPERVADLKRLRTLSLYHCLALSSLPEGLAELPELEVLNIVGCTSLRSPPRLPDTVRIETDI